MTDTAVLRAHAEQQFAAELEQLATTDERPRPPGWRLSPWATVTYLIGDGDAITPKYIGRRRLMELAVATLATDRALLLLGVPGTAKTWVGEHLAAAISGDSTLLVQGTSGIAEESIRYGWDYARLLAHGPSREALVPSPVMRAMEEGRLVRIEELTRIPSDVQDALINHSVGEDAADPRAGRRGPGPQGLQRDRHGQRPRQGRQRAVLGAQAALQHRRAPAARRRRRGGHDRRRTGGAARRRAGSARRDGRLRRDPPRRDSLPRAALGHDPRTGGPS